MISDNIISNDNQNDLSMDILNEITSLVLVNIKDFQQEKFIQKVLEFLQKDVKSKENKYYGTRFLTTWLLCRFNTR